MKTLIVDVKYRISVPDAWPLVWLSVDRNTPLHMQVHEAGPGYFKSIPVQPPILGISHTIKEE